METKEGIKEILKRVKPILKEKFKVKEIGIFGSYIQEEESKESDVDILVESSEPIAKIAGRSYVGGGEKPI